jgi:acyl-CoA synthetase (AMP-forming)/AMP-acid ligase II
VGLADPRFGQRVCAIIELQHAAAAVPPHELVAFVKQHLADHKAPRALVIVEELGRAPNGKLDYKALLKLATEREMAGELRNR